MQKVSMCHLVWYRTTAAVIKHWVSRQKSSPKTALVCISVTQFFQVFARKRSFMRGVLAQAVLHTKPSQYSIQTRIMIFYVTSKKNLCATDFVHHFAMQTLSVLLVQNEKTFIYLDLHHLSHTVTHCHTLM